MDNQIYFSDLDFIDDIKACDIKKVKKKQNKLLEFLGMIGALGVFILVLIIYDYFELWNIDLYHTFAGCLLLVSALIIAISKAKFILYDSQIIGLTYGIVTKKQTLEKYLNTRDESKIYPWWENNYNGSSRPALSYVKTFYYVDSVLCGRDKYLEHICCYEEDYNKIKNGDKIIIVRFENNNVIAIAQ